MGPVSSAPTVAASNGGSPHSVGRRPRLPRRVSAPASVALVEVAREPGAVLALVKEPVATHAAEELTGLERLRQLLVRAMELIHFGGRFDYAACLTAASLSYSAGLT